MLRLGIVGCGVVTVTRHLPALQGLSSIQVTALCDTDAARLATAARRYNISRTFDRFDEFLKSGTIDAVAICVPPSGHASLACAVLDAGLALYVEKPIAPSLHEASLILSAARRSAKPALIGFNLRNHRLVEEGAGLIASGALGKIHLVRSTFTSNTRSNKDAPAWRVDPMIGGLLQEQAIHHFDLWRFLLRAEVQSLEARLSEDALFAAITAGTPEGVFIQGGFSEGTLENSEIDIYGARGLLRLSLYEADGLELLPTGRQMGGISRRIGKAAAFARSMPRALLKERQGAYIGSYRRRWEHFADCVSGKAAANGTLEDGCRALELLLAAKESVRRGGTVLLRDICEETPA